MKCTLKVLWLGSRILPNIKASVAFGEKYRRKYRWKISSVCYFSYHNRILVKIEFTLCKRKHVLFKLMFWIMQSSKISHLVFQKFQYLGRVSEDYNVSVATHMHSAFYFTDASKQNSCEIDCRMNLNTGFSLVVLQQTSNYQ